MKNSEETKNTIMAEVYAMSPFDIDNPDSPMLVGYKIGDKYGREIVSIDQISPYNIGHKVDVEYKLSIDICSEELKELIEECDISLDYFLEIEIEEPFDEKLVKIKNEVSELDKKYENLKISEYFKFMIDEDGSYMSVSKGVTTRFLF